MNNHSYLISAFIIIIYSINQLQSDLIHWSYGSFLFPMNKSLEFEVTVLSPTTPGIYPVIFFLTGYSGLIPYSLYNELLTDIATFDGHNSIIVSFDKLGILHLPDKEEMIFELTLNWAVENLNNFFNSDKTPDLIKKKVFPYNGPNGYTIMSHSAGAHPTCSFLKKQCGQIKKVVWLDPVDGYDPTGVIKQFCTNPPLQLPVQIPTLIIATGLDNVSPSPIQNPCAPDKISNGRFYDALSGPTYYLNFTDYGHADSMEQWLIVFTDIACAGCDNKVKNCDLPTYRENIAKAINYFIVAVDEKNPTYLKAIQQPENSGMFNTTMNILSKYKTNGFDILETGPFCKHQ